MSLINIALTELGAQVIQSSSSSDSQVCQPNHVLMDQIDLIWNSGEGIPQYLIISLQKIKIKYSHIPSIGFHCWHDYQTNPKTIQIEVAESSKGPFIHWTQIHMKHQVGKQLFNIHAVPASYRVIKIIISQTFGDYETYLNQVFIMVKPLDSKNNSEMSINQLEYHLKESENKSNGNSRGKEGKYKNNDRKLFDYEMVHTEQVKRNEDSEGQYQQNTFNQRHHQSRSKSQKEIDKLKEQNSYYDEDQNNQSFQKNVALLALSKKIMQMEDNMQQIKRNVQVLQLKISISHQNLQKTIMEKVQKLVDKKIQKLKKQLKQQIKYSRELDDLRQVKSQKDKRQFIHTQQLQSKKQQSKQYLISKGKSERQPQRSLHLHNLNHTQRIKESENKDVVVADLMAQLAFKLKQRELKVKRMENTGQYQSKSRRNKLQR